MSDIEIKRVAKLVFANRRFFNTFGPDSREAAERAAEGNNGIVRPFSVEIMKINDSNEVTDWKRGEGFSVWI